MASVEFRHVDKRYPDGTRALEDLNLYVEDGELMVLVGPSGCGKSTALRLLAGLETVTKGELLIAGQCVNERSPQHRDIAMVFQNYALYPHMTVRRNLEFPLRMMKLARPEILRRVEQTARLLSLSELLDRKPRQLSGGQRQRVAMGRAIVREPQVFLLDEPLSNLDAGLRTQIRAEIAGLQRSSAISMLYVTHDQVEAMTLGDRIAVLDGGRLQQLGRPQELYDRPANTFVAAFLGNPGMNIFDAVVNRESARLELAGGSWQLPLQIILAGRHLTALRGSSLLAGLRPEMFTLSDQGAAAVVESVESLGHETLVYFKPLAGAVDGRTKPLVARLAGTHTYAVGESIRLALNPEQLHLFSEAGDRIPDRTVA